MLDFQKAYEHADRLLWAIENLVTTARPSYYDEQHEAHAFICAEARELSRCLLASNEPVPSDFNEAVESLLRVVQWLKVAGYDPENYLDRFSNCPDIPPMLSQLLRRSKTTLRETLTKKAEEQIAIAEVEDAQKEGLFEEFVGRSPGKGALSRIGPFLTKQHWQGHPDEGPDSWTEETVFKYSNNRWIIQEEHFHREMSGRTGLTIREVRECEAALSVFNSEIELDVATLTWARKNAALQAEANGSEKTPPRTDNQQIQPTDELRMNYRDPNNYWRNVWLYEQRRAGKTNAVILKELGARATDFAPLDSENALRTAIESIAEFHRWPLLKGKPGRPKASAANRNH